MLVVMDVGNTNTVIGVYQNDQLLSDWRIRTEKEATIDELGILLRNLFQAQGLALEPGTVFFEAKAGPYLPLAAEEKAPWAPAEGDPGVADYYAGLVALFR